ncbi:MAG: DegT/DnrJ/EryC1/StrS family aminotransferase [Flavobacteriales bacterium]|nr:DegT/DnrJ/EryC1/StrS family aminotransferase [Flavobacteriales bacterium]
MGEQDLIAVTAPSAPQGPPVLPIQVTKAFLPPFAEYSAWLGKAYGTAVLTNNGPIHRDLEEALRHRFDVPYLRLMSNGTLAIQLAIRALGVKGKVITTPYSYVATTSAILWEGCDPVFVDVDRDTCCIDPALIEAAITPDTTAILATHVYGIPCDVEAIDTIARKHGLKVIYDAAHAFDVTWKGRSILQWGDASTLSFHATKLFHTVEGGAVVLHEHGSDDRLRLLRSFGHIGDEHYALGMNAKMSEVHAAMGMAILPHMPYILERRRAIVEAYDRSTHGMVARPRIPEGTGYNHAYYPVFLNDEQERELVLKEMAARGINCRRYFYPSLDTLPYVSGMSCPVSRSLSNRVLCLPLYPDLTDEQVLRIADALLSILQAYRGAGC